MTGTQRGTARALEQSSSRDLLLLPPPPSQLPSPLHLRDSGDRGDRSARESSAGPCGRHVRTAVRRVARHSNRLCEAAALHSIYSRMLCNLRVAIAIAKSQSLVLNRCIRRGEAQIGTGLGFGWWAVDARRVRMGGPRISPAAHTSARQ